MSEKLLYRYLNEQPTAADGSRSLRVSFSSEAPVLRRDESGEYYEVLSHDPQHADIKRLQNGAFLDDHNFSRQPGGIEKAWIDTTDRVGRAIITLAETLLGKERFTLMKSGLRTGISVGYMLTKLISETRHSDGRPIRRYAWKAYEISTTAVAQDTAVGVGRSIKIINEQQRSNNKNNMQNDTKTNIIELSKFVIHDHPDIAEDVKSLTTRALVNDQPITEYKTGLNELLNRSRKPLQSVPVTHRVGRDAHESAQISREFSLTRAMSNVDSSGKLRGCPEAEFSQQIETNTGQRAEGFWLPEEICISTRNLGRGQRDMTVGNFGAGGAAVPTQMMVPSIELLYNKAACARLGATTLSGLTGNVVIPREDAPTTANSVAEVATGADSQLTLGQITLSPKRVCASTTYGKQLVFQSAPDIEAMIRNDIFTITGLKHDYLLLNGAGSNSEPLGILNTPGVQQLPFGGAATFASIVAMETALGKFNADRPPLAYLTTPNVRGKWKSTAVALTGATTVSSRSLWQDGNFNDGSNDGLVNSYRAAATNQVPNDQVIFGSWADLIYATWNGFDVVVDYVTLAKKAEIVLTVNTWLDCALRHPQSFCYSQDSGAQ
jgi:HK97 family phage major capsid protein